MRIGIIGASGKAGSHIAQEAKWRRHDVTAIVRNAKKLKDKDLTILEKDLFDLTVDDLKEFDAVVDAFGTAFDPESAKAHQTSLQHLTDIMESLPDVRLLVVGGAASLYADRSRTELVLESIPEQFRAVPANMKKAFEALQESSCKWTYFSPAPNFDPKGPRTGKYRVGSMNMVSKNSKDEPYLSYADYAVAMLDEIEDGKFIGKRFTASSEKQPDESYFGTQPKEPSFEGISRYCPPLNYELVGKRFNLVMGRYGDILVNFITGKTLEFTQNGTSYREPYQCVKGSELAYFVNFELSGVHHRTNMTLILDLQTRLVTVVKTFVGHDKRYPTLCDHDFDFGAIDLPGFELPKKRHGYTTDLVGKRIQWHYNPGFAIVHVYYHPRYVRGTFTREAAKLLKPSTPEQQEAWLNNPYDEPAVYVKIRHNMYVVAFIEQSMARRGGIGNSLLFLMNTDRLHDVGRSFGHSGQFGGTEYQPENYLFGAYGEWMTADGDEQYDNDPPFYNV